MMGIYCCMDSMSKAEWAKLVLMLVFTVVGYVFMRSLEKMSYKEIGSKH